MPSRNGTGTRDEYPRPSFTAESALAYGAASPCTAPNQSPIGTLTDGSLIPPYVISSTCARRNSGAGVPACEIVIQKCVRHPAPSNDASVTFSPGRISFHGAPLRPSAAVPPAPRAPVGFSKVAARDSCPRSRFDTLLSVTRSLPVVSRTTLAHARLADTTSPDDRSDESPFVERVHDRRALATIWRRCRLADAQGTGQARRVQPG
jgi:hypothetical protein